MIYCDDPTNLLPHWKETSSRPVVTQVGVIARYEILNYFRSRRFLILLVIDLLISGLLTFVVAYYGIVPICGNARFRTRILRVLVDGCVSSLIVVFCAVFFGGDAISGEFQNKTGYFLVGNPDSSLVNLCRKMDRLINCFLDHHRHFYRDHAGERILLPRELAFPRQFGEAFVFTIVYLISALGFTFFFSSLFKSSAFSILVTVILLLFGFTLIDTLVTNIAHIEPWFTSHLRIGNHQQRLYGSLSSTHYTTLSGRIWRRWRGGGGAPSGLIEYIPTIPEGLQSWGSIS